MALFLSNTMTAASGSVAGTVYSHNRGGQYMRAKRSPVNPRTVSQVRARQIMSQASSSWSGLSDAQRASWNIAAESIGGMNRLGQSITPTGQNLYVSCYSNCTLAGIAVPANAPTPGQAPSIQVTNPMLTVDALYDVSSKTLLFSNVDQIGAAAALCFTSTIQSAGAVSRAVPYRFFGSMAPSDITAAFTAAANARVYTDGDFASAKLYVISSDGVPSAPLFCRMRTQA